MCRNVWFQLSSLFYWQEPALGEVLSAAVVAVLIVFPTVLVCILVSPHMWSVNAGTCSMTFRVLAAGVGETSYRHNGTTGDGGGPSSPRRASR